MFLKIHRSREFGDIVAVCDRELLNTILRDGDLEVSVTEAFYGNTPATGSEVQEALKQAGSANLMGGRSVAIAIGMGLVKKSGCRMIGSVPHAQIYRL